MVSAQRSGHESISCFPWLSQLLPGHKDNLFTKADSSCPKIRGTYSDLTKSTSLHMLKLNSIDDLPAQNPAELASNASLTDVSERDLSGFDEFESNDFNFQDPIVESDKSLISMVPLPTKEAPLLDISSALDYCHHLSQLGGDNKKIDDITFDSNTLKESQRQLIGKGLRGVALMSFPMSKEHTLKLLRILVNINALDSSMLHCALDQHYRQPLDIRSNHETVLALLVHPKINSQSDLVHTAIYYGVKHSNPTSTKFGIPGLSKKLKAMQEAHPNLKEHLPNMQVKMARSSPSGGLLVSSKDQYNHDQKRPLMSFG